MADEKTNSEQLADLPYLEVPRPEEAGTHPTSTSNMPPMKNAPEELKEVAAKASDPASATARKAAAWSVPTERESRSRRRCRPA